LRVFLPRVAAQAATLGYPISPLKKYGGHGHACRGCENTQENMPTASVGMAPKVNFPLFQRAATGCQKSSSAAIDVPMVTVT